MVLEVLRHRLPGVQPLADLGVRDVAGDDQGAGQRQAGLHRVVAQLGEHLGHRPVEVDPDRLVLGADVLVGDVGQVVAGLELQLLEEHPLRGDPALALPIGGAGDRDRHRQRGAVPGQPDDPYVVAEVLAAELCADAEVLGELQDLLLHLRVTEAVAGRGPLGRQRVEVLRGRVLRRLQRGFRGGTADHHGQVVGRAGGGAESPQLLVEEGHHGVLVEDRLGLLVEVRLVGRAAALGHEEELVLGLVTGMGVGGDVDLGGQVAAGVLLVPHRQRGVLRVAQVELGVRVEDTAGDRLLVLHRGQHVLAAVGRHDRGAGVLAHRQHAAGGDVGVLQQVECDEPVVVRRLGVVQDLLQLRKVGRAQEVGDVVHRRLREEGDRLRVDLEERTPTGSLHGPDALSGEQAVRRLVRLDGRQHVLIEELGHGSLLRADHSVLSFFHAPLTSLARVGVLRAEAAALGSARAGLGRPRQPARQ
ncbi:hypothetical protein SDC9_71611 [bioreactor metagenome]|uniref:Uncharacterized protein n=1 Tax=bioreactor metagenome TaxID=1076179 RepID=A0A644YB31_9ZZZZ